MIEYIQTWFLNDTPCEIIRKILMKKKIKTIVSYVFVNIVLLVVLSFVYGKMMKAAEMYKLKELNCYILIIGLILFMFGLLMEYKRIFEAFKKGFYINKTYFIIGIIMLIFSCLPYGILIPVNIKIGIVLNYKVTRYLFSIWSGILIARSLIIKKNN